MAFQYRYVNDASSIITHSKSNEMKISKSRLLQLTYLAIIIIFSFQSCTTDSDEITTEYDSGIIRDTTTIESVVNLLSDSGQDELNGFVHSCKIDNYHLHLLAYSKDEDLLDLLQTGEAPEEQDLIPLQD